MAQLLSVILGVFLKFFYFTYFLDVLPSGRSVPILVTKAPVRIPVGNIQQTSDDITPTNINIPDCSKPNHSVLIDHNFNPDPHALHSNIRNPDMHNSNIRKCETHITDSDKHDILVNNEEINRSKTGNIDNSHNKNSNQIINTEMISGKDKIKCAGHTKKYNTSNRNK
jgi:hypothetical protein